MPKGNMRANSARKANFGGISVAFELAGRFYLGGYYGTALGNQTGVMPDPTAPGFHSGALNVNNIGFTGGLTGGYNWQFAPHWLAGLEGDVGYLGISRSQHDFNEVSMVGVKTDWYGTARARFGYVTGPSVIYATGGAAFVHATDTFGGSNSTPTDSTTTKASWTAGGGIETKLTHNWSTKSEYLFIDGGGSHNFLTNANSAGPPLTPTSFNHNYHVMKTGLNYQFGGPDEGLFSFFNAPRLPSDHDWAGLYVGVNAGGGMSAVNAVGISGTGLENGKAQLNGDGLAGGGQVGYNWTNIFGPKWFVGVEADFGALRIRSSLDDWFDTGLVFTEKTNWYATARGRFGTNTGPALLYVTGGAAWVNTQEGFAAVGASTGDLSTKTTSGWTIGGGTEVAIDSRWSAKLESLYIDTGHTVHATSPPGLFGADFKRHFEVVRAGLNYKLF